MENTIKISVRIMAHPSRAARAQQLASQLTDLDARIILDPDPNGKPSAMRTARRAWADIDPDATHQLVLQDDVTLPHGFSHALKGALAAQPARILSLCAEWSSRTGQACRLAAYAKHGWVEYRNTSVWAAGVVMPVALARLFVEFSSTLDTERDSWALYLFAQSIGSPALTPVPSLIQHDAHEQVSQWARTLDQGPRRAAIYLDDVSDVHWTSNIHHAPALPYIPNDHLSVFVSTETPSGDHRNERATDYRGGDYIAGLGYTQDSLTATFSDRLMRNPLSLLHGVAPAFSLQVWTCAFLLGSCLAFDDQQHDLTSRVGDVASRTMAAGALKRLLPLEHLDVLVNQTPDLVLDGLVFGIAHNRKENS